MPNQVIRPATAVMFANQVNTLPEPALTPMNARKAKAAEHDKATQGKPLPAVRLNMPGAFCAIARPSTKRRQETRPRKIKSHEQRARELVYMSLDAADHAEVSRHAFMI